MDQLTGAIPWIPTQMWPYLIIWMVLVKGLALWRSSRMNQKYWFIAMHILHLFGLIDLIYLLFFSDGFLMELLGKKTPLKISIKRAKK